MQDCRLVAHSEHGILGWAELSPYSKRAVYSGVAGVSIYITSSASGKGIGCKLLLALIEQCEKKNIWTLQAGIFPENIASIKLHKKYGFCEVGRREKIGKLNGNWRDVILLERRRKDEILALGQLFSIVENEIYAIEDFFCYIIKLFHLTSTLSSFSHTDKKPTYPWVSLFFSHKVIYGFSFFLILFAFN